MNEGEGGEEGAYVGMVMSDEWETFCSSVQCLTFGKSLQINN